MNARTPLLATIAAILTAPAFAAPPAHTPAPCTLITDAQIKDALGTPVLPGKPGDQECKWLDAKGETRIYISVKDDSPDFKTTRDAMQASGRLVPVTGLAGDAFFIGSAGTSAAFYALKDHHVLLLTVDGVGFTRAQNEAAEKTLATQILPKL
jgi:hypothetical protein